MTTRDLDSALLALDDYVRNVMSDHDAASYEEDLFARALSGSSPELSLRDGLLHTFRALNERGSIQLWLTARDVERIRAKGVRAYVVGLDQAHGPIPDDAELLIVRVPLDLTRVHALDGEILTPEGKLIKKLPDIQFDREEGAIYACCEAELARAAVASRAISRLFATDDDGRRLVLEL